MDEKEIKDLLDRYKNGVATEEEKALLESWYLKYQENDTDAELSIEERMDAVDMAWHNIEAQYNSGKTVKLFPRIATAAAVIIGLSVGAYISFNKQADERLTKNQIHDVSPGTAKAILKMGRGKTIVLDNSGNGLIAQQGNTAISKAHNGQLEYSAGSQPINNKMAYDTIQIPAGGKTYRLKLADGTLITLNTATTLRFPESFTGSERKVELINGEAYFEVVHNQQMPFRVLSHGHWVEDIGTHFNISAYDDEPLVTTLLEGTVKVMLNAKSAVLRPGQQAIIQRGNTNIAVKDADTDEAIAWKEGLFMFNDEKLANIMRQVSRWYNVEVVFKDQSLKDKLFSGSVSRFSNASQVLSKLALTGSVHFKITGRRIEVTD